MCVLYYWLVYSVSIVIVSFEECLQCKKKKIDEICKKTKQCF